MKTAIELRDLIGDVAGHILIKDDSDIAKIKNAWEQAFMEQENDDFYDIQNFVNESPKLIRETKAEVLQMEICQPF